MSDATREPTLSSAGFVASGAQISREQPPVALLDAQETEQLRSRWTDIQADFVDEPRDAVRQADELVASTVKHLAEAFAAERGKLEQQWDRSGEVSTEDLRQVLQRYRSFFNRLLSL
jgi:hypothetical protein